MGKQVSGYPEESATKKAAWGLRRAAQLYVSACLADGPGGRVEERGALLEGAAIEYAKAVAADRPKRSKKKG
jgi:hypothetical protein